MPDNNLYIVRCEQGFTEARLTWLRIENAYPFTFVGSITNMATGVSKIIKQELYLCKEHYDKIYPLTAYENIELPKN